jgi:hypothetical protein
MSSFKLISYRVDGVYDAPHFFILNRGNNSGKPLKKPCPNCFVLLCNSEKEKESLYWVVYALHQGHHFYGSLVGSVIPFIRKKDLQDIITAAHIKTLSKSAELEKTVTSLLQLEQQETNYLKLQKMIRLLKQSMVHQLINA